MSLAPYYQSERVTLYCGDCRAVVDSLGLRADMIFTDPPYGHNNNNNNDLIHRWEAALGRGAHGDSRPICNDSPEGATEMALWLFAATPDILPPGGCCCCCCAGGGPDPQFARWSLWMDERMDFKQMVVWDKGPMGMGWHYRRSYETVLVGVNRGAKCKWYDDSKRVENIIRDVPKIIPRKTDHPTPKPVELPKRFIGYHTMPDETVLDPFTGSGTTGVAAVQLGRKFIGIELEERYCEIAAKRIQAAESQYALFEPAEGVA